MGECWSKCVSATTTSSSVERERENVPALPSPTYIPMRPVRPRRENPYEIIIDDEEEERGEEAVECLPRPRSTSPQSDPLPLSSESAPHGRWRGRARPPPLDMASIIRRREERRVGFRVCNTPPPRYEESELAAAAEREKKRRRHLSPTPPLHTSTTSDVRI
jgi:hypothetical protein